MPVTDYISVGHGMVVYDTKPDMILIDIALYEHVSLDRTYKKKKEDEEKYRIKDMAKDYKDNILLADIDAPDMKIKARWLNRGSNRITPPVLYAGTTVEVYKYKDSDRYYYEPLHLEPDLQGKEVVVYAFSNTDQKKEDTFGKAFKPDTSVTVTVSTLEKRIELKTPTNEGEPIAFSVKLDMAAGKLTLDANNGEKIVWDPANKRLDVNVTTFNMVGKYFSFNASSTMNFFTNTFLFKAGKATFDVMCKFMKLCDHMTLCKFNGKSKTSGNEHTLY